MMGAPPTIRDTLSSSVHYLPCLWLVGGRVLVPVAWLDHGPRGGDEIGTTADDASI